LYVFASLRLCVFAGTSHAKAQSRKGITPKYITLDRAR
jgi:hypothetical protein